MMTVRVLAVLVDLTAYLNEKNLKLQGEHEFIHQLYSHVKSFQAKRRLWEAQLRNCNTFHFAILSNHVTHDYRSFADELCSLNNNFNDIFQGFNSR
jgi:hypothetical protein